MGYGIVPKLETLLEDMITQYGITNCNKGIVFSTTLRDHMLTLDEVVFSDVNTGVHFYQDEVKTASITDTDFYLASTAISITSSNATSVQIVQCCFTNSHSVFLDVAVVEGVDFNGEINSCNFYDVPYGNAILMTGNHWIVQNTNISGFESGSCSNAISFTSFSGSSSLVVDQCNIDSCVRGIYFSASGELQLNGGSIDVPSLCIYIDKASAIRIQDDAKFQGCGIAIQGQNFVGLECLIKDLSCNGTGPIQLNSIGDGTNGNLINIDFTMRTDRAIVISAGVWYLNSITVSDPVYVNGDGGAFHFGTSNGLAASFDVSSCDISDSSAKGYGGAIYADAVSLNIKDGYFESNSSPYGGAVFIASLRNSSFSVIESSFTNNKATNYGGGIAMESSEGTEVITFFDDVFFEDNTAFNGAAIVCCQLSTNCNITVGYDSEISLSGNVNLVGNDTATDVLCNEQELNNCCD